MARRTSPSPTFDARRFQRALEDAGIDICLDDDALSRLEKYVQLRAKWSRVHNLTGPQVKADVDHGDLVDSLALIPMLSHELPLVDVGSGNGTPGLVVACAWSAQPITLVEPISKRSAFLRTAAMQIGLRHVHVINGRWPAPLTDAVQVCSRAVAPVETWPEMATSAGAHVVMFHRMLAARRPPVNVEGFSCIAGYDYVLPDGVERRVERWSLTL